MPIPRIGYEPLNSLYRADLRALRSIAAENGINKRGSVEVLRASLIHRMVLPGVDLSWEGIQSKSNAELGDLLRIFGVKASGSHRERRQRMWLHVSQDANKMTVDSLALAGREEVVHLCEMLELPTEGTRTVLVGRVAGVLTSQNKAWGRIKRSLRRNGLTSMPRFSTIDFKQVGSTAPIEVREATNAVLENVSEILVGLGINNPDESDAKGILSPADFARMVQTVGLLRGALWTRDSTDFLVKLMEARGRSISGNTSPEAIHRAASAITDEWAHGDGATIRTYTIADLEERYDLQGLEKLKRLVRSIRPRSA